MTKAIRLTREMRTSIRTKVLAGFQAAEYAKIEERRIALGIELYEMTYGEVEPIVTPLSEDWRSMCETVEIECEGFNTKYPYAVADPDILDSRVHLGKPRPFPCGCGSVNDIQIKKIPQKAGFEGYEHPLWAKARKLVQDHLKLRAKEDEMIEKINSLLRSCNTVKQLEAAWPEAIDFLPKGLQHTTALVPVGLSDQINKALGIPSKASAATSAVREAAKS